MLGRLEMNIDDCIDAFTGMMDEVFERKNHLPFNLFSGNVQERYSSSTLTRCIQDIIRKAGFSPDAKLREPKRSSCKVYACSLVFLSGCFFYLINRLQGSLSP